MLCLLVSPVLLRGVLFFTQNKVYTRLIHFNTMSLRIPARDVKAVADPILEVRL